MSPRARVLATLCLCCSAGDVARVRALRVAESTSNFETGLDGWTTGSMDRAFVREPRTPGSSPQRGPRNAGSGEAYVYAETSQSNFNVDYDLVGSVAPGEEVYGITFEYYLFGTTLGSATLETSADGDRCRDARHVHTHPSTRTSTHTPPTNTHNHHTHTRACTVGTRCGPRAGMPGIGGTRRRFLRQAADTPSCVSRTCDDGVWYISSVCMHACGYVSVPSLSEAQANPHAQPQPLSPLSLNATPTHYPECAQASKHRRCCPYFV